MATNPFIDALNFLGRSGEGWRKGTLGGRNGSVTEAESVGACLVGAVRWPMLEDMMGRKVYQCELNGLGLAAIVPIVFYQVATSGECLRVESLIAQVINEQKLPLILGLNGIRDMMDPRNVIMAFNDNQDTTWADVRMVLEKCAAKWEETHG